MQLDLALIFRTILMCMSFIGLTASARHLLKLNRFIAPFFTASSIVIIIMLSGILHVLKYGFLLLYFGGFAGGMYVYLIQKKRPDFALIGTFALLMAYLFWRLNDSRLFLVDDFSHWALAARLLLERDVFPSSATPMITFQSYPLGSACFIYYFCRFIGNYEGLWLIAQNLLHAAMLLPLFSHVDKEKKPVVPALTILFLLLFKNARPLTAMHVDWLLAFGGIGICATILYECKHPRRALLVALPGMIASVWFKSSGIFFPLCGIIMLIWAACRFHEKRSEPWKILFWALLAVVGAFLLWSLHVKLNFDAGFESKHAVSLETYLYRFSVKSKAIAITIAEKMIFTWLRPREYQLFALLLAAACFGIVLLVRWHIPEARVYCTAVLKGLGFCLSLYAAWFVMIYVMYIFSMPNGEAVVIAAFHRYNSTGLLFSAGLAVVFMLRFLNQLPVRPNFSTRLVGIAAAIVALLCAPLLTLATPEEGLNAFYSDLVLHDSETLQGRANLLSILAENDLPTRDGHFIVFAGSHDNLGPRYHYAKFETQTADITTIFHDTLQVHAEAPYLLKNTKESVYTENPLADLANEIPLCDAILICEPDPVFEAKLEEYLVEHPCDTPVFRP